MESLERHHADLGRDAAIIRMAAARIEEGAGPSLSAPRPYPELAHLGWRWLKEERYWVAFTAIPGGHAVTGVFYDAANLLKRL